MFHRIYEKVTHFGTWAVEQSGELGKRDALAIIKDALDRTYDEDMRVPEVFRALEYLQGMDTRPAPYINFRKGLAIQNADERLAVLKKAYASMV